jgi:hypothetical protein
MYPDRITSTIAGSWVSAIETERSNGLNIPVGRLKAPRISPDGARIASAPELSSPGKDHGIVWIYDLSGRKGNAAAHSYWRQPVSDLDPR